MSMPSKEELKAGLHIENDDFQVLSQLPSPEEVSRSGAVLVKLGELFGGVTWLWKTLAGRVLAVILIALGFYGAVDNAYKLGDKMGDLAVISMNNMAPFVASLPAPERKEPLVYVAFTDTSHWSKGTAAGYGGNPLYPTMPLVNVQAALSNGTIVVSASGHYTGSYLVT